MTTKTKSDKPAKAKKATKPKAGPKSSKPAKVEHEPTATVPPTLPDKTTLEAHIRYGMELGLTIGQIEFVEVYLTCYNGVRSWMALHPDASYEAAAVDASRTLRKPHVQQYIHRRMADAFENVDEAKRELIRAYTYAAFADRNELVEVRRGACRYCYGKGNRYQFTAGQMELAREEHEKAAFESGNPEAFPEFDEKGGIGYDPRRDPNQDCPECFGRGAEDLLFHDTTRLSPAASAIYEGAEMTKDGMKINMIGRREGLEKLSKIHRLYEETNVEVVAVVDSGALDSIYEKAMKKMEEARAKVAARDVSKD